MIRKLTLQFHWEEMMKFEIYIIKYIHHKRLGKVKRKFE